MSRTSNAILIFITVSPASRARSTKSGTEIESASANDSSDTVQVTVSRSKNLSAGKGAVRQLFRAAVKAITRRSDEEAPQPRRRSSGETGKAFATAATALLRRAARIPAGAYAAATAYLDTLDWLRLWDDNAAAEGSELDEDANTKQNYSSPHL